MASLKPTNKWVDSCRSSGQGLSFFAGVDVHHQNGIAERRIRKLQELAQIILMLHANKQKVTQMRNGKFVALRDVQGGKRCPKRNPEL